MQEKFKIPINTIAVVGILILVAFTVIFIVINKRSNEATEEIAIELATNMTARHGDEIKFIFDQALISTKGVNQAILETDMDHGHGREFILRLLKSHLENNPEFLGIWVAFEPDAFESDEKYLDSPGTDYTGRFVPYYHRLDDNMELDICYNPDNYDYYKKPKATLKDQLLQPLTYTVERKKVTVVTVSTPIIKDGEFKGAVGVDYNLADLQEKISGLKFNEKGYASLVSNDGYMVAHPDSTNVGKFFSFFSNNPKIYSSLLLGESYYDKVYDEGVDEEIYRFISPIYIRFNENPWLLVLNIPLSTLNKDFVQIRNSVLLVGVLSIFLILSLIAYSISRWNQEAKDRMDAQAQLSDSYAQLMSYMEGPEYVNIYSLDRNYCYLNFNSYHKKEMKNSFNAKPETGKNILKLFPQSIAENIKQNYDRALDGEHFIVTSEYDGNYFQQIFNPIYNMHDKVIGLTSNFINITDKVNVQKELEKYREHLEELVEERTQEITKQKEFFQNIIDQDPSQIFVRDAMGRYVMLNTASAKTFHQTVDELIGKTVFETHHDHEEAKEFAEEDRRILKDDLIISYESHVVSREGDERWYYANKSRLRLGEEYFVLGVFVDITHLKNTERRLQLANNELNDTVNKLKNTQFKLIESEKMASLGQLTAGIAHEINNPINFVAGNVSPLMQDLQDLKKLAEEISDINGDSDEPLDKLKEIINSYDLKFVIEEMEMLLKGVKDGADRINGIVKNLGTFASPEEKDLSPYNLIVGLNSTMELVRYNVKDRITFQTEFDDIPTISCYPNKLNQVFLNLINNAIQAIPKQGKITIQAKNLDEDNIEITIADTGEGIPDEVRSKIFDPFFTTKEVGKGTGLGLPLSFSIVEQHGGNLSFESELGKGTTFRVVLPAKKPANQNSLI